VERVRAGGGPGRLPDLHLGGLGPAAASRRRAVHPGRAVPAAGARGGHAEKLRPPAHRGRDSLVAWTGNNASHGQDGWVHGIGSHRHQEAGATSSSGTTSPANTAVPSRAARS